MTARSTERLMEARRAVDTARASGEAEAIRLAEDHLRAAQQAYERESIASYFGGRFTDDAAPTT